MQTELKIERKHLNKIITGEKTEDYRSLSTYHFDKFCKKRTEGEHKGLYFVEGPEDYKPIRHIKFMAGYSKKSPFCICEIEMIRIDKFVNFIPEGFKKGYECFTIYIKKVVEVGNIE